MLSRDELLQIASLWDSGEVKAKLLNVEYHVCVEVDDLCVDKRSKEHTHYSHESFLHFGVLTVSAFTHLLVQVNLDKLLGQFHCGRDLAEDFQRIRAQLHVLQSVVVFLNLVGVSHAHK